MESKNSKKKGEDKVSELQIVQPYHRKVQQARATLPLVPLFPKKEKLPEMKAWLHLLPELIKSVDKFKEALNEFNDFIFENTEFNVEQNEI